MSVNEDLIQASSDSFWEIDQYKRTVKRHADGHRLCDDFINMIQERADIEKHHAKNLKGWAKKWSDTIEKGPEYGTTEASWRGMLGEAEKLADLHIRIKEQLMVDVQQNVKQWQKENYHKPMVGPIKETKELEDKFRKAQKPWAKLYAKVQKAKKDHHTACKLERSAIQSESNSRKDSGLSPDALKKLTDRVEKCRKDVDLSKDKYQAALREIDTTNAKYMEEMNEVFEKAQEQEKQRTQFFKELMFGFEKSLNLSQSNEYSKIYEDMLQNIENADYSKDLKWWSMNHGVDMAMNWPQYEEYSPDMHHISKNKKQLSNTANNDGITLTAISSKESMSQPPRTEPQYSYDNPATTSNQNADPTSNGGPEQNPFGEDDWDTYENQGVDDSKGVPVRALYDYSGQEEDELTFKSGDLFMKLLDADEQGWCTGKKDGKMGLYPNNYVENV